MKRFEATLLVSTLAILCPLSTSMAISKEGPQRLPALTRRGVCLSFASAFLIVPRANALQERNEALCATGFFENIGQWYCTPIGNISDEGKGFDLSKNQENVADSLMSKLMMDNDDGKAKKEKSTSGGDNVEQPRGGD